MEKLTSQFGSLSLKDDIVEDDIVEWDATSKKKLFRVDGDGKNIAYYKMYDGFAVVNPFVASYPSNDHPIWVKRTNSDEMHEAEQKEAIVLVRELLNRFAKTLRKESSSSLYEFSESHLRTCFFAIVASSKELFESRGFYYDDDCSATVTTEESLPGSTLLKYSKLRNLVEKCNFHSKNASEAMSLNFNPNHVFLDVSIKLRKWQHRSFFLQHPENASDRIEHIGYALSNHCVVFDFELKYQNMKYITITPAPSTNPEDYFESFAYKSDINNNEILSYKPNFERMSGNMKNIKLKTVISDNFFETIQQSNNDMEKTRYLSEQVLSKWRYFLPQNIISITNDENNHTIDEATLDAFSSLLSLQFKLYGNSNYIDHIMTVYSEAVNGRETDSDTKGGLSHYRLYREREFDAFLNFKKKVALFKYNRIYECPAIYCIYAKELENKQDLVDESAISKITIFSVALIGIIDALFYDIIA